MRYFPILQELFQSDSAIFLLVGLVFGTVMGLGLRAPGKRALGSLLGFAGCLALVRKKGGDAGR
nr:hypothetical protein [uncultured Acetatifactor sp.]